MEEQVDIQWTNTYNVLVLYMEELSKVYKNKLSDSRSSGELINSISYNIVVENGMITATLNMLDYWEYIENGRSPGSFPNVDAIKEWIVVKPISWEGYFDSINQAAYVIGRSIEHKGIQGKHYLEQSYNEVNSKFMDDIQNAINMDISMILQGSDFVIPELIISDR